MFVHCFLKWCRKKKWYKIYCKWEENLQEDFAWHKSSFFYICIILYFVYKNHLVNERFHRHQKQRETCCNMQKEDKSVKNRKPSQAYGHDLFVSYGCKDTLTPKHAVRQCYRSSSCQHSQGTLWKRGNQATHSNNNLWAICGNIHQCWMDDLKWVCAR